MSYDQRGRPYGAPEADSDLAAQKGSVRAARERMQAAQNRTQLPDTSKIIGLPQRPNQHVLRLAQDRIEQQPQPRLLRTRGDADRASPPPQWPLPNVDTNEEFASPSLPPRSPKRLRPPQQTMRPTSDDYPIQQLSPEYPPTESQYYLQPPSPKYTGASYEGDGIISPSSYRSSRPLTTLSAASEGSSIGEIPDFPVPQPPMPSFQQARRMPSLGPPPSARRGPSSYYTQMSYVSPIVEESDTRSDVLQSRHGSFASSNVIPTNSNGFYPEDEDDEYMLSDDDATITSDPRTISPTDENDRRILMTETPALVRQASLGRRTKPSIMTIKSVESFGDKKGSAGRNKSESAGLSAVESALLAARAGRRTPSRQSSLLSNVTTQAEATSPSESIKAFRDMKPIAMTGSGGPKHPLQQEIRSSTMAERAGMRRPPKLDIDAVRDAEARGSLTSLPDLIRRATRLAANLDRGKTASRLGLDFWESGDPEKRGARQSGLSDMLAAFPPPGQVTPLRSGTPNDRMDKWPSAGSRGGVTDSRLSYEKTKRRRRCCGMPLWTFITLMIVLIFVIAAAVVIPVVLVVLPNQSKGNSAPSQDNAGNGNSNSGGTDSSRPQFPAPTLAPGAGNTQCDGVITCQNGGISILNSDRTCNCVCINGFTGKTCTDDDATGCTTTTISGAANNATMGTAISRLLSNTANDLKIPLDSTRVLSLFSQLSLSCAAQNALITFNGLASRSVITQYLEAVNLKHMLEPTRSLPILHQAHPAGTYDQDVKRQTVGEFEPPSEQKAATPTQPISSNVTQLDFARVSVLFALQQTGELNTAAKAQEAIQSLLTSNRNGNSGRNTVDVGLLKMNFDQLTITFKNGTIIQASPVPSTR
jgi:hypothetical protein